ncbi:hypothetical protein HY967_05010 [Candidatus Jorgensenbacteria bacterium]|nr:hypothetical protein [Candidatus Jorgensenbacteria bacterium]
MPETPQPQSVLDRGITGTIKRLEYLRGKQPSVGLVIKALGIGLGALMFIRNMDKILLFFDNLTSLMEKGIYAVILAVVLWLLWQIVSSKKLRDTVTLVIDRTILKIHKWLIARDKFGSAEFAIRRLEKRKNEADEARASVYAAYNAVTKQVNSAKEAAEQALTNAKGFDQEMKYRAETGKQKVKMSDEGLQRAFASAKSTLRINADFLKRQAEKQTMLQTRCNILQEVSVATGDKLEEMKLQLTRAKQDWELALQTMNAMAASDEIVGGQDAQIYHEALDGIAREADFFNGRVIMLMDRLDPTVQSFRTKQAGEQIADEQYYQAFLNETKITPKKQDVVEAQSQPLSLIEDAESLLGGNVEVVKAKTSLTQRRTIESGKSGTGFDSLLRPK